jgi:hypothetical protein
MTMPQTLGPVRSGTRAPPETPEPPQRPPTLEQIRQSAITVDPSEVFGCVDWFLYPNPERELADR